LLNHGSQAGVRLQLHAPPILIRVFDFSVVDKSGNQLISKFQFAIICGHV
jgi:hypothetical protein